MTREALIAELTTLILEVTDKRLEGAPLAPDEPIFGSNTRLALDSLDALQVSMALLKRYRLRLADSKETRRILSCVGNILAAALGGIMVPRFVMPESMQVWAGLSPMAWALDGFHAVILRQGSAADIALPCLKLLILAASSAAAALWLHHSRRAG